MRIKPSLPNFKDDMYVVEILNGFQKGSWLDTGTRDGSKAYKLDASARWDKWAETVDLTMSNLTSPEAPPYFQITNWRLVGAGGPGGDGSQETVCAWADHMGYPPHPDDTVMIVKDQMAWKCLSSS